MDYNENEFKAKANIKARRIGLYLPFCLAQTTAQMYPRVGILPQITSFF